MAECGLKLVRDDPNYVVMTQHPDYIHPKELSQSLGRAYGDKKFKISLRRNIYVVYITKPEVDFFVSTSSSAMKFATNNLI